MPEVITDNIDLWTSALLAKSTAGRGSNGRVEAYGIKKLRELILATALRGSFEKENESLSNTIEQDIIKVKKAYYKTIGKRPKEYDFGPALLDEFDLPAGWLWKRVGELCDLQTGATPSTHKPEYFGGDIRWLVSGDINQGIIEECEGRISEDGLINSNCKILPLNTVLIALNGQGKTRASVALLKVPAACNQSLVGMIPFDESILSPMFLLLSLKYRYYEIRDITGQNQRRGLNMGLVSELSIPLPPLAEQHRIVAKVDELMVLCDQLEQRQTNNIEAHQTLVETLLGTLTTVESQEEFAEAWTRIANHFDTLFTTEQSFDQLKQTILQLAVMGKLDKGVSGGWETQRLDKVCSVIVDCPHSTPKWTDTGKICVRTSQFKPGKLDLSRCRFVSESTFAERVARLKPETDDILYSREGGILGVACRVPPKVELCLGQRMMLMRPASRIVSPFLELVLNSPVINDIAQQNTTGGAAPRVNVSTVKSYPIPVPSLDEQHRIVTKVNELMTLCDALKARLAAAQTTQIHLADTIVEQAVV